MKPLKILNNYGGIGGNRKLWENVEVTAVELDPTIAGIYQDNFPEDTVIVGDAHQYLLDHYKEFDFIWSSPPCPSHSRARYWSTKGDAFGVKPIYPDMMLYQEIIFLQHFCDKQLWCVENTISYYDPLIKPQTIGKHYLWANFRIINYRDQGNSHHFDSIEGKQEYKGFNLEKYSGIDKRKILRNCVYPPFGKHVLDCARGNTQLELTAFSKTKRIDQNE